MCKVEYSFDDLIWDIGIVPGYKTKVYNCICGHETVRLVPITEAKKKIYQGLLGQ